jgi:EAL domain-containing protein (putative c-di-GMP-specific phosphodiesterase class I)
MARKDPIRVVIVDDHEMILQSVVRMLSADERFVVVKTGLTGEAGIDAVRELRPSVLVLDYHLPDMEAPETIRRIREFDPEVKIVTFSGSERPGASYAAMRAGSTAWVRKTRAIHDLRDAITRAVAGEPFINEDLNLLPKLDELVLHYQPVVCLDDGRVAGLEALVRWQHPKRGLLYPDAFLAFAEETGFIAEIDAWVRDQAFAQLASWQEQFPMSPSLWMSVNLSAVDIADAQLLSSIRNSISVAGLSFADVVIEVTESVLLDDNEPTKHFMEKLGELGVGLALDDFGKGFSSVSYLQRFNFDHLKLDISFTSDLPNSLRAMLLVEEFAHVAELMSMTSIAEGIEDVDQLVALRKAGWKYGQGYLFSPAVDPSECEQLLAKPSLFALAI